jgi:hypothetical protein
MCDKEVGELQENLQPLAKGMPKVLVQRAEEIFPALKENMMSFVHARNCIILFSDDWFCQCV